MSINSVHFSIIENKNNNIIFGDLIKLKEILVKLKRMHLDKVKITGDDVSLFKDIEELLLFAKKIGINVALDNCIDIGKSNVIPYVTSLESDVTNFNSEDLEKFITSLLSYDFRKNNDQKIGINIELLRSNYNKLYEILFAIKNRGIDVNYLIVNRTMPFLNNDKADSILTPVQMNQSFQDIVRINNELDIDAKMVGAFSIWTTPYQYHKYINFDNEKLLCDIEGNLFINKNGAIFELGNILVSEPLSILDDKRKILEISRKY